ncbi:MAG: hypothetical protein ACI33S_04040 [Bacilli bacterium]
MELLVLWLGTSITSFCMEMANELRMFKDVADAGYKIDIRRLSDLSKQLNPNASKATLLSILIPIFNIMQVFQRTVQYNNVRPMILDQLNVMDALEEMSEIEKQEYQKKPTGLNALLIPLKAEIRISKAASIKIDTNIEKSEIFYEMDDSLENITILKVNGDASRLTVDEQKKKVIEAWKNIVSAGLEKYGDKESFANALRNNTNLDLSHSSVDKNDEVSKPVQELSISDQKQALENLKNELLEEQLTTQKSHTENGPTLTKRRK